MDEIKEVLKNQIKKGDTVHTITRQVSASGMYRHISIIVKSGEDLLNQSYNIAKLLGYTYKDKFGRYLGLWYGYGFRSSL